MIFFLRWGIKERERAERFIYILVYVFGIPCKLIRASKTNISPVLHIIRGKSLSLKLFFNLLHDQAFNDLNNAKNINSCHNKHSSGILGFWLHQMEKIPCTAASTFKMNSRQCQSQNCYVRNISKFTVMRHLQVVSFKSVSFHITTIPEMSEYNNSQRTN